MKNNILVLLVIFSVIFSYAFPAEAKVNPNYNLYNKGKISGKVIDLSTSKPVSNAAVRLLSGKNLVKGTETDIEGKFLIEDIEKGKYSLEVSIIGYKTLTINEIVIDENNLSADVGIIKISQDNLTTGEIKVEAEQSPVQISGDKKIFNVEQTMPTPGGNALDVLRKIPSVSVDNDGNVSLRGNSSIKILIDGKPSGLDGNARTAILQSIPSDQIANVEIITNPSAKYEAEATSGIINIIMKKKEGFGYNGSLQLNAGTGDKYYGSMNFNVKKNSYNLYGNYDYRRNNFSIDGSNTRDNFLYNTNTNQSSSGYFRGINNFAKLGLDFDVNDNNSFTLSGNYVDWNRYRSESSDFTSSSIFGGILSRYNSRLTDDGNGYVINSSLNYTRKYKDPNKSLTADFYFSKNKFDYTINTLTNYILPAQNNPDLNNQVSGFGLTELTGQSDYVHPFGKNYKLESGIKGIYRNNERTFRIDNYDYSQNAYITTPGTDNEFTYKEQIYAVYATFSGKIKEFSYSAGLRGEQTFTNGELKNANQNFDKKYFDLFPSLNLSQKLGMTEELSFSYTRRINRPQMWFLNPFKTAQDPSNIFSGNPELNPEYMNSFELSFIKYFTTTSITPTVFFRQTNDKIERTRTLIDSNTTLTTFQNYSTSKSYGAEIMANTTLFKFWNLNGSISYFKTDVDATNLNQNLANSSYSWSGRITSSMRLPDIFDLQISYFYSGKQVVAQGTLDPFHSLDISLKKEFFDKRVALGLRFADVFNTLKFNVNLDDPNYRETFLRKNDSRNIFLTLTYKFGTEEKKNGNKRRNRDNDNQNQPPINNGF